VVVAASISQWNGDGAGGRGGQEVRGMGGSVSFEKGRGWGRERKGARWRRQGGRGKGGRAVGGDHAAGRGYGWQGGSTPWSCVG
jgi:hypothetical protein